MGQLIGGMTGAALLAGTATWLGFRAKKRGRSGLLFWALGGLLGLLLLVAIANVALVACCAR